jgi:hypothetical protein
VGGFETFPTLVNFNEGVSSSRNKRRYDAGCADNAVPGALTAKRKVGANLVFRLTLQVQLPSGCCLTLKRGRGRPSLWHHCASSSRPSISVKRLQLRYGTSSTSHVQCSSSRIDVVWCGSTSLCCYSSTSVFILYQSPESCITSLLCYMCYTPHRSDPTLWCAQLQALMQCVHANNLLSSH